MSHSPEPTSGRARKDVAYTPSQGMPAVGPASVRSVSPMRAPPQLPSQVGADSDDPYDLLEDLATPTRQPNDAAQPLPTGPIQPLQTGPMPLLQQPPPGPPPPFNPPPSQPMFAPPPSQRGPASGFQSAAMPFAPPPSQRGPITAPPSQRGPATAPPGYASGPMSVPGQPITGPQTPVMQRPEYATGSYPTGTGQPPPSSSRTGMTKPDDGVPLGYVVASAFFLAIALVGFGLYLAFEVISL